MRSKSTAQRKPFRYFAHIVRLGRIVLHVGDSRRGIDPGAQRQRLRKFALRFGGDALFRPAGNDRFPCGRGYYCSSAPLFRTAILSHTHINVKGKNEM